MSKGFESARADAMKICGPEIQGDGYSIDTNGAFNRAKGNLEKKMGFIDQKLGGVDKEFTKVSAALARNGQAACEQVGTALGSAWKEINLPTPKVQPSQTAQAKPSAESNRTAKMDLGNITAYAAGTSRTDRMMKEMGI